MILDLNDYRRVIRPMLKDWIDRDPEIDRLIVINAIAQLNSCHLIAVTHYMMELEGKSEKLTTFLASLHAFYTDVEVEGHDG